MAGSHGDSWAGFLGSPDHADAANWTCGVRKPTGECEKRSRGDACHTRNVLGDACHTWKVIGDGLPRRMRSLRDELHGCRIGRTHCGTNRRLGLLPTSHEFSLAAPLHALRDVIDIGIGACGRAGE
jgi:hypothetical protein